MPPQPNCPPTAVPWLHGKQHNLRRVVLHYCLNYPLTLITSNSSHLRYTTQIALQRQATVKFHGVFASHWKSLAFAPGKSIQEILLWDSSNLVIPFMQAVIQTARHFAHVCYFRSRRVTDHFSMADAYFYNVSLHRYKDRTISSLRFTPFRTFLTESIFKQTRCLAYSL